MTVATVAAPLVFAVGGALTYALASNPKLSNIGLVTYGCGVLWLVELLAHVSVRM